MASTLDNITGLIPVALAAGITMKVTDRFFPQQARKKSRQGKLRPRKWPSSNGWPL